MGQHLQLYASKNVSIDDAQLWCSLKLREAMESPTKDQEVIVGRVWNEMRKLDTGNDHLEHWSAWAGVQCFALLSFEAHICNDALINRAVKAGEAYRRERQAWRPDTNEAKRDWANDDAIKFLRSHIGYVVWGYNDGI